ncbi:adenine methyltransferase [Campylobacter novaezeelandiae]|uniref:adenine methyltransferase n=1 Tax=Campylobacter novaezeelandiae TaxID=2267891 RepID=UPI003F691064
MNLGSFYTPSFVVEMVYKLLEKHIKNLNSYTFLDSSCGYGDFFTKDFKYIGADIDKIALEKVKINHIFHTNALLNINREKFKIKKNEKLIIIGNPPYNDKTSIINAKIKKELFSCDEKLKYRDLGISFLRSYECLEPDFICVLHPLSYLIKEANFKALKDFKQKYKLVDGLIISSSIFTPKSSTHFPIIISFYKKDKKGMDFEYIKNFTFKSVENYSFCLKDFDFINNYVRKYPNLNDKRKAIAYFHTLRDINALKRNKTFMKNINSNTIKVFKENLTYYIYIHFFKEFCYKLPYCFGNLDIFIDKDKFLKIEQELLNWFYKKEFDKQKIENYFKMLFSTYLKE